MKFLNVGVLEFVFILLLAFIVLGPKQAVKTAGEIGRWIKKLVTSSFWRELVSTTRQIQELPRKFMDEAEIQDTLKDLERATNTINSRLEPYPPGNEEEKFDEVDSPPQSIFPESK